MSKELYYKPSGKFNPIGFFALFLITVVTGSLTSLLYLFLVVKIPSAKLSLFLPFLMGGLLGAISCQIARFFKIRNRITIIVSAGLGIIVYNYIKWAFFISYIFNDSYISDFTKIVTDPEYMFDSIKLINKYGTWGFNDDVAVTGAVLAVIWIIEFLMLLGVHFAVLKDGSSVPFIESENAWAHKSNVTFYATYFSVNEMRDRIEQNPKILLDYIQAPTDLYSQNHVEINIFHSSDFNENYIDVSEVTVTPKRGKEDRTVKRVMKYFSVSRDVAASLFEKYDMPLQRH